MKPIDRICSKLDAVQGSGPSYQAPCPAHEDDNPSLSIKEAQDGRVLLKCHAGCSAEDIVHALGLSMKDLFPDRLNRRSNRYSKRLIETYDYTDETGEQLFQVVRFEPKDFRQRHYDPTNPKAKKEGWVWGVKGIRRVLYRLPKITKAAQEEEVVYLVEGEKDVHSLERLGIVATCNPMGAGKWRKEYTESLHEANVVILPDNDTTGREHAETVAERLHGVASSVRIVELPGLPAKGDVSDWIAAGGTAEELRLLSGAAALFVPPPAMRENEGVSKGTDNEEKPTQAQELIEIASRATLFHTPAKEAYATFPVGTHHETASVSSRTFSLWLRRVYYQRNHRPPSNQALSDALSIIESQALFDGAMHEVYLRTAGHKGNIYVDLCNERWEAVKIAPEGWSIISAPPVRFVRRSGMKAMPTPLSGGSLSEMLAFVNMERSEHAVLLYAWLVHALRPSASQPVLVLTGEQGTGKSTLSKMLRYLTDPSVSPIRSEPRNEQDLVISAENGWVQVFENLSGVKPWLSDALCRLTTGAGFATRKLYAGREEELFYALRPVVLNGIDDLTTRPDLASRSISLFLKRITDKERRQERELWPAFYAVAPRILGAIFTAMATALRRLPETKPDGLPRMADFGCWVLAAEASFPKDCSAFIASYADARHEAEQATLERDAVAASIMNMLEKDGAWEGSMTDLCERLLGFVPNGGGRKPKGWPRNGRAMSAHLRRIAPALRAVAIAFEERGKDPITRRNLYAIEYDSSQSFGSFDASTTDLQAPTKSVLGEGIPEALPKPEASTSPEPFGMIRAETSQNGQKTSTFEASNHSNHGEALFPAGTIVQHRLLGLKGTVTAERSGAKVGVMPFGESTSQMVPEADLERLYK